MTEPRTFDLDASCLPDCHRCGAPAVVTLDHYGITHVSWRHERDCRVLRSSDERVRLDAALAGAIARGSQRGAS